jgi:hypothetical protein
MRQIIAVLILLAFAGIGIAQVTNPDWFVRRSSVLKVELF